MCWRNRLPKVENSVLRGLAKQAKRGDAGALQAIRKKAQHQTPTGREAKMLAEYFEQHGT